MANRKYTYAQLGMLFGIFIGGGIGVVLFVLSESIPIDSATNLCSTLQQMMNLRSENYAYYFACPPPQGCGVLRLQ